MTPIDIDSINAVMSRLSMYYQDEDRHNDEHGHLPHNPVVVYDTETGRFTVESELTPLDESERIVSGQLDTSEGLAQLFEVPWSDVTDVNWVRDMFGLDE